MKITDEIIELHSKKVLAEIKGNKIVARALSILIKDKAELSEAKRLRSEAVNKE